MRKFTLLLFAFSPLWAGDLMEKFATGSTTTKLEAAPTIHLQNSRGEVTIEGWDQPGVEVTVFRWAMKRDAALDRVKVSSEKRGDEIVVATEVGKEHGRDVIVNYEIKAPRGSKLVVEGARGGVYASGIDGPIDAHTRGGVITLLVPGAPQIDARTTGFGQVYSEFPEQDKRHHWMMDHEVTSSGDGQKLTLRSEHGDIVILKDVPPKGAM